MIINTIPETRPLFKYVPKVKDERRAQLICHKNPLFSWHAAHFNKNFKKNLLLVNDLTGFPVIIPHLNYVEKEKAGKLIPKRIRQVFSACGFPEKQIEHYFLLSSNCSYSTAFSERATSLTKHFCRYMSYATLNAKDASLIKSNLILTRMPIRNGCRFRYCDEYMRQIFNQPLNYYNVQSEDPYTTPTRNKYHIRNSWLSFSNWDNLANIPLPEEVLTDHTQKIRQNNELLLAEFEYYLFEYERLSILAIDQHLDLLETFLDDFLLSEGIGTPVSNYNDIAFFINHWYVVTNYWSTPETVIASGESLKLFYIFLMRADEITVSEYSDILTYIQDGVLSGVHGLQTGTQYRMHYSR